MGLLASTFGSPTEYLRGHLRNVEGKHSISCCGCEGFNGNGSCCSREKTTLSSYISKITTSIRYMPGASAAMPPSLQRVPFHGGWLTVFFHCSHSLVATFYSCSLRLFFIQRKNSRYKGGGRVWEKAWNSWSVFD